MHEVFQMHSTALIMTISATDDAGHVPLCHNLSKQLREISINYSQVFVPSFIVK